MSPSHPLPTIHPQDAKYPGTKKPLGFSVLGIIVNPRDGGGEAVKYDRSFGRNLRTEDAADAGKIFFEASAAGGIVRPLVEAVLARLRALLELYRELVLPRWLSNCAI